MHRTLVINVVGLTPKLLGHMPSTRAFASAGRLAHVGHMLPAVTCSVQATYLTGTAPSKHGIVGNGWYDRDECEIKFWKQSDKLVQQPRIWEIARQRDAAFTCANLFWWYAMYSSTDVTVTPRPQYRADGRKIPDIWTHPPALRDTLQQTLGQFPLFHFWGPASNVRSSRWIADALLQVGLRQTLTLVYLPHLDYALQQYGPDSAQAVAAAREIDAVIADLLTAGSQNDCRVVVLSEYGIEAVTQPVHLNRELRTHGLLQIRTEGNHDLLDAGASRAFAVADHQVAHVYVKNPGDIDRVSALLRETPGVDAVYAGAGRADAGLDHPRAGDIVVTAARGAWFTYYFWEDDRRAPDYARTVDIHRKPGYDPLELFLDPAKPLIKAQIGWKLAKKKLGLRSLLDVIPLDARLVRGSHGRAPAGVEEGPLLISSEPSLLGGQHISPIGICELLLRHVFD